MEQQTITIPAQLNLFDVVTVQPYYGSPDNLEKSLWLRYSANKDVCL